METITYNLNTHKTNKSFYTELSDFTDYLLQNISIGSVSTVNSYMDFIQNRNSEPIQSFNEYYLEYLTMGVLLNQYSSRALALDKYSSGVIKWLFKNRKRSNTLKPYLDKIRGVLTTIFLTRQKFGKCITNQKEFQKFIDWLEATGEFSEEVIRLKNWQNFFKTYSWSYALTIIKSSAETAEKFETEAKFCLGIYTKNVASFQNNELPQHRYHENYLFCGRYEVEYHLNMVGAEILNRSLKNDFWQTNKKVLLLPTCMSKPENGQCMAKYSGLKLSCTGCSGDCNINRKRIEYAAHNIEVALIPHSSGFSKFLEYWKNQQETGLIGVACVLNLLKGGYEMKKLNIPSQCVFLDYCGCKKHWHKEGIATNLNDHRLKVLLG
jgi:uncharacterized protein